MATPRSIPISNNPNTSPNAQPNAPAQLADHGVGLVPISSIRLPPPVEPSPFLAPSSISSAPRRIITPPMSKPEPARPRSPGGSTIEKVKLLKPFASANPFLDGERGNNGEEKEEGGGNGLERRLSDEMDPIRRRMSSIGGGSSTLRPNQFFRPLTPAVSIRNQQQQPQGHVNPLTRIHQATPSASATPSPSHSPTPAAPRDIPIPSSFQADPSPTFLPNSIVPPSLLGGAEYNKRPLARSIGSFNSFGGETTIRAMSIGQNQLYRDREYMQILRNHASTRGGSVETMRPPEIGLVEGNVDELLVEWCVLCGKAKDKGEMELREIQDETGDGSGVWWVCKKGCESES